MSIRWKLTIILLSLVAIPLVFVGGITFANYRKALMTDRLDQLEQLAQFRAEKIESYFAGLRLDIETAQSFYNVRKNLPILAKLGGGPRDPRTVPLDAILDFQLVRTGNVLGLLDIMLADTNGRIVYVSNPAHYTIDRLHSLASLSEDAYREGGKGVYVSDVFPSKVLGGRPEMFVVAPIRDLDGLPAGLVIFELDMASVYGLINDTTGLGSTGEVLIGKSAGNEIVYVNPLRHDRAPPLTRHVRMGDKIALPAQKAVQGETGVGPSVDYRGHAVIAAWVHMRTLGWGLVAKIDRSEAFADVTNLQRTAIMVLVVALAVAGTIAFSVAQSISLPIRRLSKGAEIVGSGNLDYRVGTDSPDEIGQLSRAFDAMTHDLKAITASRDVLNREIAERRRAEEALRKTTEDLVRSNKDLEQFAYVASHDLQEPLRAVAGFMGLLKDRQRDSLDKESGEFIDLSIEGAERMQNLIHDLLSYSRVGTRGGEFQPMAMRTAVDEALANLRAAIAECDAVVEIGEMPTVAADLPQMIQLMQNLIGNAIKFRGESRPEVHIGAERKDRSWVISVRDNGIGMESQYFERIFLIFQRLHARSRYEGTGIGLAVCKRIVERHGGAIWVESEPCKGSTFHFSIPDKGESL
jgi:signal transduction histidine kinase